MLLPTRSTSNVSKPTLYDRDRGTSKARGYDRWHRQLRVQCFVRDGWRCVACGWEPPIVFDCRRFELGEPPIAKVLEELARAQQACERHLHADHKIRIELRPDLRLDLDNLQTLCDSCHNRKSMRELRGQGRAVSPRTLVSEAHRAGEISTGTRPEPA